MIKYLLKSVNEYRVETKEDADALHKQIEEEATDKGWTLSGWNEAYKTRKAQGEIVEEWYVCKSTVVFNDQKEPETVLKNIEYNMEHFASQENAPWEESSTF